MAAYPTLNESGPVTPDRKTRIAIDVNDHVLAEAPFGLVRRAEAIALGREGNNPDIPGSDRWQLVPGIGIQIKPIQANMGRMSERTPGDNPFYTPGSDIIVPTGVLQVFNRRTATEIAGLAAAAAADTADESDPFLQLCIGALESAASAVTSVLPDKTAFPGLPDDASFGFDRRAVTTENHDPNDAFTVRFDVPGALGNTPDEVARFYFCGPATFIKGFFKGYGQWAIRLFGNGVAALWERGQYLKAEGAPVQWRPRKGARWCEEGRVGGLTHSVQVKPHVFQPRRGRKVGVIAVFAAAVENSPLAYTSSAWTPDQVPNATHFVHTVLQDEPTPTQVTPLRIDQRSDLRNKFQPTRSIYPSPAVIVDGPFQLRQPPKRVPELQVNWFGKTPPGTTITVELLYGSDDGTEPSLTQLDSGIISGLGGWAKFQLDPDVLSYKVRTTLTSTGKKTPTLYSYKIAKNGQSITVETGEVETRRWTRIQAQGPVRDQPNDSATVRLEDLANDLPQLRERSEHHVEIRTEYAGVDWAEADPALRSVIVGGYVIDPDSQQKGQTLGKSYCVPSQNVTIPGSGVSLLGQPNLYPSPDWHGIDLSISGDWLRLNRGLALNWDFAEDPDAVVSESGGLTPYKVTDVIYYQLIWAGYPDRLIDIGPGKRFDLNIRLFAKDTDDGIVRTTAGQNTGDLIKRLAMEYLGAIVVRDRNSSRDEDPANWNGLWTLIMPKMGPTFTNLAYFDNRPPGTGGTSQIGSGHMLGAWPLVDGAQGGPIISRSFSTTCEAPEANMITVSSTGDLSSDGEREQFTLTVYNFNSFNFDPDIVSALPAGNPDYLTTVKQLIVVDSNLGTPGAVHWATRRYFDYTAHGRKIHRFVAPLLLVTDPDDPHQVRPRPLRYYDPVMVKGVQCIIRDVKPFWNRDVRQMARYEVEVYRPGTGLVVSGPNMLKPLMQVAGRVIRKVVGFNGMSPALFESQKRSMGYHAEILAHPTARDPITAQILDPTSDDFGKMIFLPGYDLPGSDHPLSA